MFVVDQKSWLPLLCADLLCFGPIAALKLALVPQVSGGVAAGWVALSLLSLHAFGLYHRGCAPDRRLALRGAAAAAAAFAAWRLFDIAAPGPQAPMAPVLLWHGAAFAAAVAARPLVGLAPLLEPGSRRVALIGSDALARALHAGSVGRWPSELSLVHVAAPDPAGGPEALRAAAAAALASGDYGCVVVEAPAAVVRGMGGGCPLWARRVVDHASFVERRLGWTDLDSVAAPAAGPSLRPIQTRVKRCAEPAIAAVLLALLAPLMALTALAVWLEDRGAPIYSQVRVGERGRPFRVLKFRSMRVDSEADGRARWAAVGDPRVTRVGRLLRLTRLDELPQLVNVLRGDMSLVGPRPERPEMVAELARVIPNYNLRHMVRPGLTGWAQINHPYGASVEDARRKTEYDLHYLKSWSLWLDVSILMQTVRVVVFAEGAR